MKIIRLVLATALVAILAGPAFGQAPSQSPPPPAALHDAPQPDPQLSISFSPIHLFLPFFEITGEYRIGHTGLSAAIILGAGSIDPDEDPGDPQSGESFKLYEIGGQLRYYFFGDFSRGWQIGIELAYVAATDDADGEGDTLLAEGFVTGAFVGYKRAFYEHYTLDIQGGVQRFTIRTMTADDEEIDPLVNINFGYTF